MNAIYIYFFITGKWQYVSGGLPSQKPSRNGETQQTLHLPGVPAALRTVPGPYVGGVRSGARDAQHARTKSRHPRRLSTHRLPRSCGHPSHRTHR